MEIFEKQKNNQTFTSCQCLNRFKIRTQVLILQIIIQLAVGCILTSISYLTFSYIIDNYEIASQQFYVRQYYKKTDMITYLQVRSSKEILFRSLSHLLKSDFLYQFIQSVEELNVSQPLDCLKYDDKEDKYQYQQTFCYGFFGDQEYPITEKDRLAMNFSAFLTQMLPVMDMDLDLLYSTIGDQMYFSIWPGDPFPNYKPHRRIWFKNHLQQIENKNYNQTYFSDPYILWTWFLYMVTQTRNLTNINGELDGVFGSDLNFSLFQTLHQKQENVSFSIIDQNGQYLLSEFVLSENKYMNQSSVSGFDQDDFQQINNSLYDQNFINNCSKIDQFLSNQRLCRYNSLTKTEELIVVKKLFPTDLTLVIQVDLLEKEKELYSQLSKINEDFQLIYQFYIYLDIITTLLSIILGALIIYITLSPITNLILFTSQQVFKEANLMQQQINQKINLRLNHFSIKTITELHRAFKNMNRRLCNTQLGHKNSTCKELEQIQYPQQPLAEFQFSKIQLRNMKLKDNQKNIIYPLDFLQKLKYSKKWSITNQLQ